MTFVYGRKAHAVVVLIDHGLGGGIKDCFLSDRPDRIRAKYQQAARGFGLDFRDYQPAEAGAILSQSLRMPPARRDPIRSRMSGITWTCCGPGSSSSSRAARPGRSAMGAAMGIAAGRPAMVTAAGRPGEVPRDCARRAAASRPSTG